MKKRLAAVIVGCLVAVAALAATVGGLPSRPTFNSVRISGSPAGNLRQYSQAAPAGRRAWQMLAKGAGTYAGSACTDDGVTCSDWITVTSDPGGSSVPTAINFGVAAPAVTIAGAPVVTESEGTFEVTLTGVAGTVTGTATYRTHGKLACVSFPSLSGTSNSTSKSVTGIPAGLEPSVDTRGFALAVNNGGANEAGTWSITASNNQVGLARIPTSTAWTASGFAWISEFSACWPLS